MKSISTHLAQSGRALCKRIDPGDSPGFRISAEDRDLQFSLVEERDGHCVCSNREHGLALTSRVNERGSSLVISSVLENHSETPSPPLDVIEPLHLVFEHPIAQWQLIYANGGAKQAHYPPSAFKTHDIFRLRDSLKIESPPLGRSSDLHLPILMSVSQCSDERGGFFCGLEWSAAWYIGLSMEPEESMGKAISGLKTALKVGVKVAGLQLDPGESLKLPPVHLGFFAGGAREGTNALRRYLYEDVCPTYQGQPVLPRVSYDHFFGIANECDIALLKTQADRAAELGIETFVFDGSWYEKGHPLGAGNWHDADRSRFPDGLEPLAEYVRELGMDFGLWFEPERAMEGTHFLEEHPDWFVPVPVWRWKHHPRAQVYQLELSRKEAQDYVIELLGRWVRKLDLRWIRYDYNSEPMPYWNQVDPTGKIQFSYMEGLYRVWDTLLREHPNLMIESCSSGGRRLDLGSIRRAHTFWISDETRDPLICRFTQARANRFLPGHLLNISVPVWRNWGDQGFDSTSILSRMLGKLSFDGDIASWSPELTSRVAGWVNVFKQLRHLFVQDFHQLLPTPQNLDNWDAVEFVSYHGDEAAVFAFAGQEGSSTTLSLRGLHENRKYRVLSQDGGRPLVRGGGELMKEGLMVEGRAFEGQLWHLIDESHQ